MKIGLEEEEEENVYNLKNSIYPMLQNTEYPYTYTYPMLQNTEYPIMRPEIFLPLKFLEKGSKHNLRNKGVSENSSVAKAMSK